MPLGTILHLAGHCTPNPRRMSMLGGGNFEIDRVGGKAIKGVVVWVDQVQGLAPGSKRTLVGYETGGMIGVPGEAVKEGAGLAQAVWSFHVELRVIRVDK